MILSLKIAWKFYRGPKNNILVSLISVVSIISITMGITVSIVALNTMNGFKYELSNRILAVMPHAEIELTNSSFVDWHSVWTCIRKIPDIIYANPYINFSGVIEYNNKWHVIYIRSIDLTQDVRANKLLNFVDKKSWKYFTENVEQIILGKGISDALGVKVGDWITVLITDDFRSNNKLLLHKKIRLQVAGVLNLHSQIDCNIAVISLLTAQYYCNNTLDIEGIAIKMNNIFSADKIADKITKIFNHQVCVRSWTNTYGYIYQDIQMIRIILYLSMMLIIGISCFNVIATLILLIKSKNYDIAIFSALGAKNILIQRVFFWYGLIIYFFSSIVGTVLGIFISFNLTNVIVICNNVLGSKFLAGGAYFIDFLPVQLSGWDIFLVLIITLFLGSLTSWYTSLQTKKISFAQILK